LPKLKLIIISMRAKGVVVFSSSFQVMICFL
jgi:hypothetical protein